MVFKDNINLIINEEAIYDKTSYKNPVYIVLMHSGTPLANLIKKVTKDTFSHAAIAFNDTLDPLYSFGQKGKGETGIGFSIDSPHGTFFTKYKSFYSVFVMYVSDNAMAKMKEKLAYFQSNKDKFKYDFRGLVNIFFGRDSENHTFKWFCSRFVMELINTATELTKVPSLWKPQDILDLSNISLVNKGFDFYKYDNKITKKNEKMIKNGTYDENKISVGESTILLEQDLDSDLLYTGDFMYKTIVKLKVSPEVFKNITPIEPYMDRSDRHVIYAKYVIEDDKDKQDISSLCAFANTTINNSILRGHAENPVGLDIGSSGYLYIMDTINLSSLHTEVLKASLALEAFEYQDGTRIDSKFTKIKLSDAILRVYGTQIPQLDNIKINKNTIGYVWIDGDKLVAILNMEDNDEDDNRWITTIKVYRSYKSDDFYNQLIKLAIREKATNIKVSKTNEKLQKIVSQNGFKQYDKTDTMIYYER